LRLCWWERDTPYNLNDGGKKEKGETIKAEKEGSKHSSSAGEGEGGVFLIRRKRKRGKNGTEEIRAEKRKKRNHSQEG